MQPGKEPVALSIDREEFKSKYQLEIQLTLQKTHSGFLVFVRKSGEIMT